MKLLFGVCISLLLFGQIRAPQDVAKNTADFHIAMYRMNEMMWFDTEERIQIVKHYMRMWKNTLYFDIGVLGAAMRTHFRYMLKLYRYHSNPRLLQYKGYGILNYPLYYKFNAFGWNIEHWSRGFVMILLEYNKILANIREFYTHVLRYIKQQKYFRKIRKQATYIHGWADARRHNAPGPDPESTTLPDEEYEIDYFGHKLRKGQTFETTTGGVDIEEKVDSMIESEKAINELLGMGEDDEDMNFTQISEWTKYMQESGVHEKIEKEKKRQELQMKQDMAKHTAEMKWPKQTNQNVRNNQKAKQNKLRAKNGQTPRNQNKGKTRNPTLAKTQNAARNQKTAGNQKALKKQQTLEVPKVTIGHHTKQKIYSPTIPKSHKPIVKQTPKRGRRDSDFEYKERMRKKFADQMRGNFDPEREGIQIDLSGLD